MFPQQNTLFSLFLLVTLFELATSMYVTKVRRLPLSALNFRQAGLVRKRALDALEGTGFGFEKRALDMLDGSGFGMKKRALDSLEGVGFNGFQKRALDSLEGNGFNGFQKRALDSLEGNGFNGFQKRALDSLEGNGFNGFQKRALDLLEGTGFNGFSKRASPDRYIRVPVELFNQLEELKSELREELTRRRMLNRAQMLE